MKQINYSGSSKLISRIVYLLNRKAPLPLDGDGDPSWGTNGQVLTTDGTGTTYWSAGGGSDVTDVEVNGTSVVNAQGVAEVSVPTATSDLNNDSGFIDGTDLSTALSAYTPTSGLATVATSGDYDDLTNKPTIPAAQVNSDWNAASGVAQILNKPTIPTVNDGTLTIQQNGTTVGTFSANQSGNTTVNLTGGGSTYTEGDGIDISAQNAISVDTAFTEASTRTNIASGDTLATIWGKIKKFFSDLKTVAFTGSYNDLTDKPSVPGGENYVLKAGDTMSGYLTIEPNNDTPLRIKRLSGNSSSKTYMLFSNVSGGMGFYAVGPDKRPWFEPFGGSDERIPLQSEVDAKNFIKDYNNNILTKFGYSTSGMSQADATWLGAWDTSVSGEYRLRAVQQAQLRVAYATSAGSATNAGNADTVDGKHVAWDNSGNVGTNVTYLAAWKNDGTLIGWVKRSDISVNYAASANVANTAGSANTARSSNYATVAGYIGSGTDYKCTMQVQGTSLSCSLILQSDYNLVLYKNGSAVWQSGTSSRRFKHNIQSMTEERARKILDVRAVTFDWNDGQPVTTQKCDNAGVIAEEVSRIIPDVVVFEQYDNDPNTRIERRVEYERFTPYLIKMVQMQQKQIDIMQATIIALEQRLSKLEGE